MPAGEASGTNFGVPVVARGFADAVAGDIAALLTGEALAGRGGRGPTVMVVGASRTFSSPAAGYGHLIVGPRTRP
ncbi:hypothetical protein [Dactylosporangium salmoneum]|uniref:Beta-ketoacyl synthase N-terminal domain-containing protein n=1 Tax=Dactylosporangium salmoneum TaxID=53361 RepID=A0ABN3I382_9ACTN